MYGVSGKRGWVLRSTLVSPGADVDAQHLFLADVAAVQVGRADLVRRRDQGEGLPLAM